MVAEVQCMLGTPVAFVVYVLTGLDDCRGWVTKSTTCAECPESAKGALSSTATRVRSLMGSRACCWRCDILRRGVKWNGATKE